MKVVPPVVMTDALLTSSTAAEPGVGETVWSSGTIYALGDECYVGTGTHRRYRSLQASNSNKPPVSNPDWWKDIGPTNRWAMFDWLRSTKTEAASPLVVEVTPGRRVDALGLVGLEADTATVEVYVGATLMFTRTYNLLARDTGSWSRYFFGSFRYRQSLAVMDLPPYSAAKVKVTLARSTGTVKCGGMILGAQIYLGSTECGAVSDALNFSDVDRDGQGNVSMTPARSVPTTKQRLFLPAGLINQARRVREDLAAVPVALWSGLDDANDHSAFEAFLIAGFYRQFKINGNDPVTAVIDLELEEV